MLVALVLVSAAAFLLLLALLHAQRRGDRLEVERDAFAARLADRAGDIERLGESFEALSARALRTSNKEFLRLARQNLDTRQAQAASELEQRRAAVDALVSPIADALKRTQDQVQRVAEGNAGLGARVKDMLDANNQLRSETNRLTQALRKPNVRGRYGEIQLERVVELAGMRRWCDFKTQEHVRGDDGKLQKPDMVVRLPNGRVIALDAKTSVDAYLDAVNTEDPDEREAYLERYAANVAEQVQRLGRKEYWSQFDSLEMVVMFVPGDQLIDAALERRPDLVELAAERNVILASPSTLIGLLRAVHVGWREKELTEHAEELFELGGQLHERAAIALEHASRVGDAIDAARRRYNEFVGSVDSRLVPTLKKFEERGARSSRTLAELRELEGDARKLQSLRPEQNLLYPSPPPAPPATKRGKSRRSESAR
ncbi:MAG: DNA recombination protein RmuC [Planctomycetota bacterium]